MRLTAEARDIEVPAMYRSGSAECECQGCGAIMDRRQPTHTVLDCLVALRKRAEALEAGAKAVKA